MNRRWLMVILAMLVLGAGGVVVLNQVKQPSGTAVTPRPTASESTVTPAATGSTQAPGTPGGSGTPSPTLAVTGSGARCATGELQLAVGPGEGAAGSVIYDVTLKNISARTCSLTGYPGVSLVDGQGNQLAQADRNPGQALGTVTLASGQSARAAIRLPNAANFGPASACSAASARLRVYPPDSTQFLETAFSQRGCPGFSVDPVQ